nr:hypothetical protein Cplu_190 [Cedratvirus plubellavi]
MLSSYYLWISMYHILILLYKTYQSFSRKFGTNLTLLVKLLSRTIGTKCTLANTSLSRTFGTWCCLVSTKRLVPSVLTCELALKNDWYQIH